MTYLRQNEYALYLDKKERVRMDKKTILSEIKKLITFSTQKFLDAKATDGTIVRVDADKFDVGMPLLLVTPDGLMPSKPGEITLEDGTRIVVDEAGVITAVEYPTTETPAGAPLQASAEEFAETKTLDGMNVKVEGDVAVGNKMTIEKDGAFVPAPEGQYNLEDGSVVYVDKDGLINEIQTPATKATDNANMADENFYTWESCVADMMDQYGDETIANAVCGKIKADGYIMSKEEAFNEATILLGEGDANKTDGATASQPTDTKMTELEARLSKIEQMMNEMLPMMKETAEFGANVINKIDTFVADTPAEKQFASIKSEYKQLVSENKTNKFSSLESIRNVRKK